MENTLSDRERDLYVWFSEAVRREREAQKMYKVAMDLIDDQVLRDALQKILKEEERHEMWLLDLYTQYRERLGLDEGER